MRFGMPGWLTGSLLALTTAGAVHAQVAVEDYSGTVRIDLTLPGTPNGAGGINFAASFSFTAPLNFTPGAVTFQGQPVDFSGTEASFLATSYSGNVLVPIDAGPATVPVELVFGGVPGDPIEGVLVLEIDSLELGPSFGTNDFDVQPGSASSFAASVPWQSAVVPNLNGATVVIKGPVQVGPIAPDAFDLSSSPSQQIVAGRDIVFGDPRGDGCLPGVGDSVFGAPGSAQPLPRGVASTATNATYEDTDNSGGIDIDCNATIDFAVPFGVPAQVLIDVDGGWNAGVPIETSGIFTVEVFPSHQDIHVQIVQDFPIGTAGVFAGNRRTTTTGLPSPISALYVNGNINMTGPPGFQADMTFVASIDGQIFPSSSLPLFDGWYGHIFIIGTLTATALWARRRQTKVTATKSP